MKNVTKWCFDEKTFNVDAFSPLAAATRSDIWPGFYPTNFSLSRRGINICNVELGQNLFQTVSYLF